MLVITLRRADPTAYVVLPDGRHLTLSVVKAHENRVRLAFDCPDNVGVGRTFDQAKSMASAAEVAKRRAAEGRSA